MLQVCQVKDEHYAKIEKPTDAARTGIRDSVPYDQIQGNNISGTTAHMNSRSLDLTAYSSGISTRLQAELRGVDVSCSLNCDNAAHTASRSKVLTSSYHRYLHTCLLVQRAAFSLSLLCTSYNLERTCLQVLKARGRHINFSECRLCGRMARDSPHHAVLHELPLLHNYISIYGPDNLMLVFLCSTRTRRTPSLTATRGYHLASTQSASLQSMRNPTFSTTRTTSTGCPRRR